LAKKRQTKVWIDRVKLDAVDNVGAVADISAVAAADADVNGGGEAAGTADSEDAEADVPIMAW